MLPILDKIHEKGIYRPNIKAVRLWFDVLNAIVFEGKIPKFRDISIKKIYGQFAAVQPMYYTGRGQSKKAEGDRCTHLEINTEFKSFKFFLTILAHEMIHSYQWITEEINPNHKQSFFMWRDKLKKHGIPLNIRYAKNRVDNSE